MIHDLIQFNPLNNLRYDFDFQNNALNVDFLGKINSTSLKISMLFSFFFQQPIFVHNLCFHFLSFCFLPFSLFSFCHWCLHLEFLMHTRETSSCK